MNVKAQLKSASADMAAADQLESMPTESMLEAPNLGQALEEHLSALPPEQQEFLAAFMTPEFAQAVGLLTANEEIFNYLASRADSSRALLPLPRETAQQLLSQAGGQPQVPEQTPTGPTPTGVMASEGGQVM
jgi:hypothetical protein